MSVAISSARSSAVPGATASVTTPRRAASAPENVRPVSSSSWATPAPAIRSSIQAAPCIGGSDLRANAVDRRASSAATRMSHISAWARPTPAQGPSIAAIIGLRTRLGNHSGCSISSARGLVVPVSP
jgi:hypothetical protein